MKTTCLYLINQLIKVIQRSSPLLPQVVVRCALNLNKKVMILFILFVGLKRSSACRLRGELDWSIWNSCLYIVFTFNCSWKRIKTSWEDENEYQWWTLVAFKAPSNILEWWTVTLNCIRKYGRKYRVWVSPTVTILVSLGN